MPKIFFISSNKAPNFFIPSDKALFSNGRYVVDASDLGLQVGKFPAVIRFGEYTRPFHFYKNNINQENELISIEYKNVTNNVLVILND